MSLSIRGAWLFTPVLHEDDRGQFLESFTQRTFSDVTGQPLDIRQANVSESVCGTVRGIHFAEVPPGQAKYVHCYSGKILDVVVDIRIGSPTFGQWDAVELDSRNRQSVYIAEGLGHAFCALSQVATVGYMCSTPYVPAREHAVHPLDPGLRIAWPTNLDLRLSSKDAAAPTLGEAAQSAVLPRYEECVGHYNRLRTQHTP